jgi:steroid delta-isomerase-like uncharacterized protein
MKTKSFLIICLCLIFGFRSDHESIKNDAVVRSFIESWNNHDINKMISLFSEKCVYEVIPDGGKFLSKQEIAAYASSTFSGIPDTKMILVNVVTNDSTGVAEWIWKGTNTVGWPDLGIPATNKAFEVRGLSIMQIRDGLIAYNKDYWDWNTFIKGVTK